jgi:hypothetical protein
MMDGLFAFVWTVASKVSALVLASLNAQSNLAQPKVLVQVLRDLMPAVLLQRKALITHAQSLPLVYILNNHNL